MNIENFNGLVIKLDYKEILEDNCKDLVDEIKSNAGSVLKSGGKYIAGWDFKIKKINEKDYEGVVYNKDHYRLTHLLENGHNVKNKYGGAKYEGKLSYVAPRKHIKPAYEHVKPKYIKDMATKTKYEIENK